MYTAQDLLNQPIILAVIAAIFILTAIILFIVPTFSWFLDKIKAAVPSLAKKEPAVAASKKEKVSVRINTKKTAYAALMVVVIIVLAVGGWYVYVNFFSQKPTQPQVATPHYNLRYSLAGSIKSIDYEKGVLIVKDEFTGKDHTLKKNPLTKVFKDRREVGFTEIKKYYLVSVRSNADFKIEDVNIFEVDIVAPGVGP